MTPHTTDVAAYYMAWRRVLSHELRLGIVEQFALFSGKGSVRILSRKFNSYIDDSIFVAYPS